MFQYKYNTNTLLSNMCNKDRDSVELAMQIFNDDDIYILDSALDNIGRSIGSDYFSLHCRNRKDLSDFWDIYYTISKGESQVPKEETLNSIVDAMKEVFAETIDRCEEPLLSIIKRQSAIIKKQREKIEALEEDQSKDVIWCGDFKLKVENVANGNDIYTIHKNDDVFGMKGKVISEADVNKKLRELYFRTEEKRSCKNCGAEPEYCKGCDNLSSWQPK